MQQLTEEFDIWESLKNSKNLLAFSAGVDSCTLFFMMLEREISFDIAIVDYNHRESSKDEVSYAQELALKYNKKIFIKSVKLGPSHFEARAREERYSFFNQVIEEGGYNTLITAHHLGDKLEWFFMKLVRGAGTVELSGFSQIEKVQNYQIIRPLICYTKDELLAYLEKNSLKYFVDESNFDQRYERNYFRKNFSEPLLSKYKDGIKRSFEALEIDKEKLLPREYKKIKSLYYFKRDENEIRLIAKILKFFKIVLSKSQRDEIERVDNCVISAKVAIGKNINFVFISPYLQDVIMTKEFKESCRVEKIPQHARAYMFKEEINPKEVI